MRDLAVGKSNINLTQVLKSANIAETGGMAKQLVADGRVCVNGQVETRKRRQMAAGDVIEVMGHEAIRLVQSP
jgi:ribosome-associated protein